MEKEIPFGIVMDERIADGHYYATAFAAMEKYLNGRIKAYEELFGAAAGDGQRRFRV